MDINNFFIKFFKITLVACIPELLVSLPLILNHSTLKEFQYNAQLANTITRIFINAPLLIISVFYTLNFHIRALKIAPHVYLSKLSISTITIGLLACLIFYFILAFTEFAPSMKSYSIFHIILINIIGIMCINILNWLLFTFIFIILNITRRAKHGN